MIQSLKYKNFKCFRDTGEVDIKPITFLIGTNSSGKSSFLQPLLMMKQTFEYRDIQTPLKPNGLYAELGSFKDFVYKGNLKETISFQLKISRNNINELQAGNSSIELDYDTILFEIEASFNSAIEKLILNKVEYFLLKKNKIVSSIEIRPEGGKILVTFKLGSHSVSYTTSSFIQFYDFNFPISQVYSDMDKDSLIKPYLINIWFNICYNTLPILLNNILWIGPLRLPPKRSYEIIQTDLPDVGIRGEYAPLVLFREKLEKSERVIFEKVKYWFEKFGLCYEVFLKGIGGNRFMLKLVDPYLETPVNYSDVGFGVSQTLPIIVQGFSSKKESLLLYEQPEIHLHPAAQANLGDLFIDIADSGRKLIIETHSEHLIGRIQRRIAEKTIKKGDIAIYYFQPDKNGVLILPVKLDKYGRFESPETLPEGFFEEDYLDSVEMMYAINEREKEEEN